MKRVGLVLLILISLFMVTACSDKSDSKYSGIGKLTCTREGELEGGEVSFQYILDYRNGNILSLHSIEQVISDDSEILDKY